VIVVQLPPMLRAHAGGADALTITAPVRTVGELLVELARVAPGVSAQLDDAVFNVAVNDVMLLHRAAEQPIRDGDRVEIVPAISGGLGNAARSS
jgi:molybdopterin converting factor small subunit